MKFVSYNIQYGFGADGRYDLSRFARVVDGADVIALQEVERFWKRSSDDDQPELIGKLLPGYHWVYGPAFDMDGSLRDSRGHLINRRRQFGTMILSKLPIVWSRLHLLPMRRVVHPLNTQNAALEAMIETAWGPLRILSLHLSHIGVGERLEQIEFLLARHRRAALEGGPWSGTDDEAERDWTNGAREPASPQAAIWMGDFNSEPGSAEYRRIAGDNPNRPTAMYADELVDAATAAGHAADAFHTHAWVLNGKPHRRRLDYCFVAPQLAGRVRSFAVDTSENASDHFPVVVDIDLDTAPGGVSR